MPSGSLMAKVQPLHSEPESELVLVEQTDGWVRLTLDDGLEITMHRAELLALLTGHAVGKAA
jgi:hypothetical protein